VICTKCGIQKNNDDFNRSNSTKNGLQTSCKKCQKIYRDKHKECKLSHNKQYYCQNKKEILLKKAQYSYKNKEKITARNKEWYIKNKKDILVDKKIYNQNHKEEKSLYRKRYYKENKKELLIKSTLFNKKRREIDPLYKLMSNIRSLIKASLTYKGYKKKYKTNQYTCCTFKDLQDHLGPKPEGKCHLDHICPCSQAKNEEELIKLQHYTNFRWLPAEENIKKSDNWTSEGEEICRKLLNRDWIH